MTWVVYALLALNLGLLTWNLHVRSAKETLAGAEIHDQASGDVKQLPLLSELNENALRPRPVAMAIAAPPATASAPGGAGQPAAATSSTDLATAGDVDRAASATSTVAVVDSNAATESAAAPTIVASTEAVGNDTPEAASALALRACLTLGPLSADAPVEEVRSWFEQTGASVDVRTDERREVALYWVFFPPRATRENAVAEVARLRGEGLTDVIAVPKGDMANAISLGVFSRTESRDRRVKQMNQRGYQPSVAPRYRVKLATWIDISAPADTLSDKKIQTRWPSFQIGRKPCGGEPVATEQIEAGPITARQEPSNKAPPVAPPRFHFSGLEARPPADTTR